MTTHSARRAHRPSPVGVQGLIDLLAAAVGLILPIGGRRRRGRALDGLDDHMLRDIGLGRGDVERDRSRGADMPSVPLWRL